MNNANQIVQIADNQCKFFFLQICSIKHRLSIRIHIEFYSHIFTVVSVCKKSHLN